MRRSYDLQKYGHSEDWYTSFDRMDEKWLRLQKHGEVVIKSKYL